MDRLLTEQSWLVFRLLLRRVGVAGAFDGRSHARPMACYSHSGRGGRLSGHFLHGPADRARFRKTGAGTFFIVQRQRSEDAIREHVRTLIQQLEDHISHRGYPGAVYPPAPPHTGWARNAVFAFGYRKELLQHLRTGNESLFLLLLNTRQMEDGRTAAQSKGLAEVVTKIEESAKYAGLADGFTSSLPSYKKLDIASYIQRRMDGEPNLGVFEVTPKPWVPDTASTPPSEPSMRYFVTASNIEFAWCSDRREADGFASRLGKITSDAQLLAEATRRVELTKLISDEDKKIDQEVERFIHGTELRGQILNGACDQCIHLHDEKNRPSLEVLISQVDAVLSE